MSFVGLAALIILFVWIARHLRQKDVTLKRTAQGLELLVGFLESLNALPHELTDQELHEQILAELRKVLTPRQIHSRLWIANPSWKTLQGLGEHAALRPGSPHHLPMTACPAFALNRPFEYSQHKGEPCTSEQFNYSRHICLPIMNENMTYGVLFLGTYRERGWDEGDTHYFEMLAQSIALALQRHALFRKLEEKLSDLKFSFEVGAAALATFSGSTQSLEETTLHILDSVQNILQVDRTSLMLWDAQASVLQTQWVRGGDFKIQSPLNLGMGEGMAGWALETNRPYWAEYAMGDPHYKPSVQPVRSLLCVPILTVDNEPLGVINAVTIDRSRAFLPREIDFLVSFARQAALAIENARLHQKNRDNIDQLSELSKLKTQFLSLVSHDLRGPLTGMRGYCEILKLEERGTLTKSQIEIIDQLERQVELEERMVDDLLDLARMEKGQLRIQPAKTDIATLLREEVDKIQMEAEDRRVSLKLTLDIPPASTHLTVDGGRIRQVLWNLIFNALKFTPEEGSVTVRASATQDALSIQVQDTGVGLAPEAQTRVFETFFQVSPGGSTSAQGLGLGLAICKQIITAHHGSIQASSEGLGKGTTILFSIPLQPANSNQIAA